MNRTMAWALGTLCAAGMLVAGCDNNEGGNDGKGGGAPEPIPVISLPGTLWTMTYTKPLPFPRQDVSITYTNEIFFREDNILVITRPPGWSDMSNTWAVFSGGSNVIITVGRDQTQYDGWIWQNNTTMSGTARSLRENLWPWEWQATLNF